MAALTIESLIQVDITGLETMGPGTGSAGSMVISVWWLANDRYVIRVCTDTFNDGGKTKRHIYIIVRSTQYGAFT